jgi:hypothetical protein
VFRLAPLYRSQRQRPGVRAGAAIAALACVLAGFATFAQPVTAQSGQAPAARVGPAKIGPADTARATAGLRATSAAEVVAMTGDQQVPAVEDCGLGTSQVRPKSLILTCADANDLAKDLVWSRWGASGADATGVDTWNACVPYCAASKTWYTTTATFTLSKPVHTSRGWLFERLTVHITGRSPRKMERAITFSEAPAVNT